MQITPQLIWDLQDKWKGYMEDSWERGENSIDFIEKSEQGGDDTDNSPNFEQLSFNFMYKLLKTVQAKGAEIELSLTLSSNCQEDSPSEKTYKELVHSIMMNEDNITELAASLRKTYSFGQGIIHVKNRRESEDTLNEVLCLENIEDPTTVFFDTEASKSDFNDGNFCGRLYKVSAKKLRELYGDKVREIPEGDTAQVCDFWVKEKIEVLYIPLTSGQYKRADLVNPLMDMQNLTKKKRKGIATKMSYYRVVKDVNTFVEKQKKLDFTELPLKYNAGQTIWDAKLQRFGSYPFGWHLQDTQILLNYCASVLAQVMKTTQSDKWLFSPSHLVSEQSQEAAAEINVRDGGMVFDGELATIRREPSQQLPPQLIQMFTQLQSTIQVLAGSYFENDSASIKAISGVAVNKIFEREDLLQNPVIKAHIKTVNNVGKALKEMIPIYYWQQRAICVKEEDGTQRRIIINQQYEEPNGIMSIKNNVKDLRTLYDYKITGAPSKRLQKQNTQIELQKIYQVYQPAIPMTIDLYAKSLDIPLADVLAKRLGVNIPQALVAYGRGDINEAQYREAGAKAKQQEQMEMANSPPAQALKAKTQRDQAEAHSTITRSQSDALNAETNRLKEESNAANNHIKSVSEATKVAMENANTQHQQKIDVFDKIIEHDKPLREEPSSGEL